MQIFFLFFTKNIYAEFSADSLQTRAQDTTVLLDEYNNKEPYLLQIGGGLLMELFIALRGSVSFIVFDLQAGEHISYVTSDFRIGGGMYPLSFPVSKRSVVYLGMSSLYSIASRTFVVSPNIMMSARVSSSLNISSKFGGYFRIDGKDRVDYHNAMDKYGVAFEIAFGIYLQ